MAARPHLRGAEAATTAVRRLTSLEDAREMVLAEVRSLGDEDVPVSEALGRVLAGPVAATDAVPPFDNSAMDGFAVRAADTAAASAERPVELRVVGESRAGRPADVGVGPGEAVGISTGAVVPEGADSIVPLEEGQAEDGVVAVAAGSPSGRFIRRRGDDVQPGQAVLAAGTSIGPAELGVLASLGVVQVTCSRRPRVAVLINGDELAEPGERLEAGQIHDANGPALRALALGVGAELVMSERVPDDLEQIRAALGRALQADVVMVSGGVSVGEHDHVRDALDGLEVARAFWGIALRPGRPTWFGLGPGGALVFGLPGNPVSAMVCFDLLVRPALLAMQGVSPDRHRTRAILDGGYPKQPGREHAVRCTLELREDGWHARPTRPEQASHVLTSMLGADALALIPAESGDVPAGTRVEVEMAS